MNIEELRMRYAQYKTRYADCKTVPGSYDAITKTIVVMIPDGRMKPSGTRGQRYGYYRFNGQENETGRQVTVTIKAISMANARKQLSRDYPQCTFCD